MALSMRETLLSLITPAVVLRRQIKDAEQRMADAPDGNSLKALYKGMIERKRRGLSLHPSQWLRRQ